MGAADEIIAAVKQKVKSGSTLAESCACRYDILKHWFGDKKVVRGAWVLFQEDFPKKKYFRHG